MGFVRRMATVGQAGSSSTVQAVVDATGVAIGQRIHVGHCSGSLNTDGAISVADNKGNVYTLHREDRQGSRALEAWSAPVTVALVAGDTITVTYTTATTRRAIIVDISNFTGPAEQSQVNNNAGSSSPGTGNLPAPRGAANAFEWSCVGWNLTVAGDNFLPDGTSSGPVADNFSSSSGRNVAAQYTVFPAVGSQGMSGNLVDNVAAPASRNWSIIAVSFPDTTPAPTGGSTAYIDEEEES